MRSLRAAQYKPLECKSQLIISNRDFMSDFYPFEVYEWLKKHCWSNHSPEGQCINTAFFIEEISGWQAVMGSYHAWIFAPNGKVLDLTVGQYGFSHFNRLVDSRTIFDVFPNGAKKYCNEEIKPLKRTNYSRALSQAWARNYKNKFLS